MWVIFADGPLAVDGLSAMVAIVVAMLGSGGAVALVIQAWGKRNDNQKEIEIKRLEDEKSHREEIARQKAQEAADRAADLSLLKRSFNDMYNRWKDIAETFKIEKDQVQKQYEEKCIELITLKMQNAELQKQIAQHRQAGGS